MSSYRYDTAGLNQIGFNLVAERYGSVKKVGSNWMALCPWHDDHTPSLLVGGKMNRCKCMSCGKGGSVIDYVMAVRNCDFKEACEILSRDFNISTETYQETLPSPKTLPIPPLKGGGRKQHSHPDGYAPHNGGAVRRTEGVLEMVGKLIDFEVSKLRRRREKRDEEFDYIPMEYLEKHVGGENSFCNCLRSIFTAEGVEWAVNEYKLGTWSNGAVMFPSIDMEGRVHNIKVQRYCDDVGSEQFFHKLDKSTFWLGSILAKRHPEFFIASSLRAAPSPSMGEVSEGRRESGLVFDSTCFFGEHLLPRYPDYPVVLVESPKNAVIGACEVPSMVWVAVGSKNNLNRKRLECLRNRKVIVIPDNDAVEEWRRILSGMKDIATFCFSSFCEQILGEQGAKGDVADYLIRKLS